MRYIIDFNQDTTVEDKDSYMETHGCSEIKVFSSLGKIYLVESDSKPPKTHIVDWVINDVSTPVSLLGDSMDIDINDEDQWWKVVSAGSAIDFENSTVSLIKKDAYFDVYVVDSGIKHDHPEFVNTNIHNLYSITGEFDDQRGHGTAIASLISGTTTSLSQANLVNVKIIDATADITLADLVESLHEIQMHSDSRPLIPAIINLSWTIPHNEYINFIIERLILSGITVFASAGNSGHPIADVTPACIPSVFTVGAYDKDLKPADFSSYSSDLSITNNITNTGELDTWAPGVDIKVASIAGGYSVVSGTSFSSAIAAGSYCYNMQDTEQVVIENLQKQFNIGTMGNITGLQTRDGLYVYSYREFMLDLSEQYNSETNWIITYVPTQNQDWWAQIKGRQDLVHDIRINEGTLIAKFIYGDQDVLTTSVVSGPDWQPEISLAAGMILAVPPALPEGEVYRQFQIDTQYVSHDNTITNITVSVLMVTTQQELLNTITPDHDDYDLIHISPQAPCEGRVVTFPQGCSAHSDGCLFGSCIVDIPVKGGYLCKCGGNTSGGGGFN